MENIAESSMQRVHYHMDHMGFRILELISWPFSSACVSLSRALFMHKITPVISANCIQLQLLSTSPNPRQRHSSANQSMLHVHHNERVGNEPSPTHHLHSPPHLQLLLKQRGCKGCQSSCGEENDDLRMQRQSRTKKQTKTTHRTGTPCKTLASLGSVGPIRSCAGLFNEAGLIFKGQVWRSWS